MAPFGIKASMGPSHKHQACIRPSGQIQGVEWHCARLHVCLASCISATFLHQSSVSLIAWAHRERCAREARLHSPSLFAAHASWSHGKITVCSVLAVVIFRVSGSSLGIQWCVEVRSHCSCAWLRVCPDGSIVPTDLRTRARWLWLSCALDGLELLRCRFHL
jgi:hypothetical protein